MKQFLTDLWRALCFEHNDAETLAHKTLHANGISSYPWNPLELTENRRIIAETREWLKTVTDRRVRRAYEMWLRHYERQNRKFLRDEHEKQRLGVLMKSFPRP